MLLRRAENARHWYGEYDFINWPEYHDWTLIYTEAMYNQQKSLMIGRCLFPVSQIFVFESLIFDFSDTNVQMVCLSSAGSLHVSNSLVKIT